LTNLMFLYKDTYRVFLYIETSGFFQNVLGFGTNAADLFLRLKGYSNDKRSDYESGAPGKSEL
jgi:hypothetical protein